MTIRLLPVLISRNEKFIVVARLEECAHLIAKGEKSSNWKDLIRI